MKRVLTLAVLLLALGASGAGAAAYRIVLTHGGAVESVRATGGHVSRCWRIAPRHFRCRAVYWFERIEAEESPAGSGEISVVGVEYTPQRATVDAGLKGVSGVPSSPEPQPRAPVP